MTGGSGWRHVRWHIVALLCAPLILAVLDNSTDRIPHTDAVNHVGYVRTVQMPVRYSFHSWGKEIFLSSRTLPHHAHMVPRGGDRSGFFTVAIPSAVVDLFPRDYAERLRNRRIEVTGEVTWFQGDPHIIVTSPSAIRTVRTPAPWPEQPILSKRCPKSTIAALRMRLCTVRTKS